MKNKIAGVYTIRCSRNRKLYVGSSLDVAHRIFSHFQDLKFKKHTSKGLQSDYNKYGFLAFNFCIWEISDGSKPLLQMELEAMKHLAKTCTLYNLKEINFLENTALIKLDKDLMTLLAQEAKLRKISINNYVHLALRNYLKLDRAKRKMNSKNHIKKIMQ